MKLSNEEKNKLTNYANKLGLRLDVASLLRSQEEMDQVKMILDDIASHAHKYSYAIYAAPKNPKRTKEKFEKKLKIAKDHQEKEDLYTEMRELEPIRSEVMTIRDDLMNTAKMMLIDLSIGKKRIDKIMPLLYDELKYGDNIPEFDISELPEWLK